MFRSLGLLTCSATATQVRFLHGGLVQEVLVMVVPPEESYLQLGSSKFPQGLRTVLNCLKEVDLVRCNPVSLVHTDTCIRGSLW